MTAQDLEMAVLALLLAVPAVVLNYRFYKRKVAEFTAFALQRGWVYRQRDDSLVRPYIGKQFRKGTQGEHAFSGVHRGREFVAFEYDFKSGDLRRLNGTHTVVALNTPATRPTLEVSSQDVDSKASALFGVRRMQLESVEFNNKFVIVCDNDRFAYDVLHPRMIEWMLADERAQELPFRFHQAHLLTLRAGQLQPDTMLRMLNYLCDVLQRVPSFVWKP